MPVDKDRMRTEFRRRTQRHSRVHAELARLIGSRGDYSALGTLASASKCRFCRENFVVGLEVYGGLGSSREFGFRDTAHYLAPALSWQISDSTTLHVSPAIGLTRGSAPVLLRFGYSYELRGFGNKVAALFGRKR